MFRVQYKITCLPNLHQSINATQREWIRTTMVKSKSSKMHLEVNNELELDINNASVPLPDETESLRSLPMPRCFKKEEAFKEEDC